MNTQSLPQVVNKSMLFSYFNKARARSAGLDRKRVNRALGLILAHKIALQDDGIARADGTSEPTYWINKDGCDCPDHLWRGSKCKHMIARWLLIRVQQEERGAA